MTATILLKECTEIKQHLIYERRPFAQTITTQPKSTQSSFNIVFWRRREGAWVVEFSDVYKDEELLGEYEDNINEFMQTVSEFDENNKNISEWVTYV